MSRRPLAPDIWEQALLNGRRIHPSDDQAAQAWSEQWYLKQGGLFDGQASTTQAAAAPEPVSEPEPAPEPEAEPEVQAQVELESPKQAVRGKRRARHDSGQYKGDDLSTPEVNEAWDGGDVA